MDQEKQDPRFRQANREALLALGAYALYFAWWYLCAYGLGSGDPEEYVYVLGMPEWFFYSCVVGCPLITLLLWALVRFKFRHMPLDAEPAPGGEQPREDR